VKVGGKRTWCVLRRCQLPTLQIYSVGDRLMITEYRQNDTDRGNRSTRREKLSQCHLVHHKSHMKCPTIKPGPPMCQTEPWYGHLREMRALFFLLAQRLLWSYASFGRAIGPSQRPLPDNTQHSQGRNIHAPAGIRTRNPSKQAAADPSLRPRGHRGRQYLGLVIAIMIQKVKDQDI